MMMVVVVMVMIMMMVMMMMMMMRTFVAERETPSWSVTFHFSM